MPDFSALQAKTKDDIYCAVGIWTEILLALLGDRLEYAYAKGSAMKPWDSPIDYVPVVSDVDIHIRLRDGTALFQSDDQVTEALTYSQEYEERFLSQRPDHLHLPRMQIMLANDLETLEGYVPPKPSEVYILSGALPEPKETTAEYIREADIMCLLEYKEVLDSIPQKVLDRIGFDFWTLIRTISWCVSPAPIRLLTQEHPDPSEVWSWNRTRIHRELIVEGYREIADAYEGFYLHGWNLFLSGFSDLKVFRAMFVAGYRVLKGCYDCAVSLSKS